MSKYLLYISTNDGSDTRINKEIQTLFNHGYRIVFLGVGKYGERNFAKQYCEEFILIHGKRNTPITLSKQVMAFIKLLFRHDFHSIHIVNEQLMVFFYPFLFHKHVVLDIFDSFFLKISKPKNQWKRIKKIIYAPVNKVLVTDENRKALMPDFLQKKLIVLENFPNRYHKGTDKPKDGLTIFYFGTLNVQRGTGILQELVEYSEKVKIIMAGWINDPVTETFSKHKNVEYLGVMRQEEASEVAATQVDYILSVYEPCNENNINASPNKIYDAIQTKTPVIINKEVKVSKFVAEKNLGLVMDSYYEFDKEGLIEELIRKKHTFKFKEEDLEFYSWQFIEGKLIAAHQN